MAEFSYKHKWVGEDVLLISLQGTLNFGNSPDFKEKLIQQVLQKVPKLCIFDFSPLEFVDSSGLGVLISLFPTTKEYGFNILLLEPSLAIQSILELSSLNRLFQVVTTKTLAENYGVQL
ncbi:MAG: STAS domain-containing protein [Spirochaetota bacterium]